MNKEQHSLLAGVLSPIQVKTIRLQSAPRPPFSLLFIYLFICLFIAWVKWLYYVAGSQQDLGISTGALLLAKGGHNIDKA